MTIMRGTGSFKLNTVSLVRNGTSLNPGIGGTPGREPVAMTKFRAVSLRVPSVNVPGSVNCPEPNETSTPRLRKRSGLSFGSIEAMTPATRCMILAISICGTAGEMA